MIKLQPEDLQIYLKEIPAQAFFCVYCKTFKNTFFTEDIHLTSSALHTIFISKTLDCLMTSVQLKGQLMVRGLPSTFSKNGVNSAINFLKYSRHSPLDTGRKLNVHKTSRTSSERLMYVQFTSCVQGVKNSGKT